MLVTGYACKWFFTVCKWSKTNQFFGETKRISENTRKQPIIALG